MLIDLPRIDFSFAPIPQRMKFIIENLQGNFVY